MKRVVMLTLGLFAALAGSHAQAQQEPLRISYVRSPFNLQLMVMKEHGILQKHLTPLGVQAFYGVCIMSIAVVWFVFVSHVFGQRRVRQAFLRLGHWFDRVMGVALIAVAVRLLIGD